MRELRQDASTWVRRAAAGETLEVTDRGRPVARLGPLPESEVGMDALESAGRLRPPRGRLSEIGSLPAVSDGPSLTDALDELRTGER